MVGTHHSDILSGCFLSRPLLFQHAFCRAVYGKNRSVATFFLRDDVIFDLVAPSFAWLTVVSGTGGLRKIWFAPPDAAPRSNATGVTDTSG